MDLLLLGLGGALGSLARYKLGDVITQKLGTKMPLGTFIINITGAILLGLVSSRNIDGNIYLLLADGFLAAYTTFSTFMYEGVDLFQKRKKIRGFYYVLFTFVLGIAGFVMGLELGKFIF